MTTYPLAFPNVGVKRSSFRLKRIDAVSESPFTGSQQVYSYPAAWWEGEIIFRPVKRSDARLVQAFLAELNGREGTFLYGDPDCLQQGVMGSGGVIKVNGASQGGNTLNVKGMTASKSDVLVKGDYFQLGTGLNARLHMITQPLNSDASGNGVVKFEPAVRFSPLDEEVLILDKPRTLMRLSNPDAADWSSDAAGWFEGLTIAFREVLDGA